MSQIDDQAAPRMVEFSKDPLILPCLMVAYVLNQKNGGWPSVPIEFAKDNDLKAQIIFDFGHALKSIWEDKADKIRIEWEREWINKIPILLAENGLTEQLRLFQIWQEAKQEAALRYKAFEIARRDGAVHVRLVDQSVNDELLLGISPIPGYESSIRRMPEYEAVIQAEKTLNKAERHEARYFSSYNQCLAGKAERILNFEKANFIRDKIKSYRKDGAFFKTIAPEVRDNCIYASALGEQNIGWLARVCENLSKLSHAKRMSLPSFSFRRKIEDLNSEILVEIERDNKKPIKTIFLDWILSTGGYKGISPDDSYKALAMACCRQDELLDKYFRDIGFKSFIDFRQQGRTSAHTRVAQLLKLTGPQFI